jgi:cobalamin biosynthesis protein CobD/CbiB
MRAAFFFVPFAQTYSCWYPPEELSGDAAQFYDSTWRGIVDAVIGITACMLLVTSPWIVSVVLSAVKSFGSILHIDVLR